MTQDDALSSRFVDPNAADRKILPLLGEKCDPPNWVRRLQTYDFTDALVRQATLPKLLVALGQSRQTVNEVMSQFAQLGIRALMELMATPEVRGTVQGIEAAFIAARDEIEELTRCKRMHEFFHRADEEFLRFKEDKDRLIELLLSSADERNDWELECENAWIALDSFVTEKLSSCVQDLVVFANSGEFRPEQILWSPAIERAIGELAVASENREIKPLNRASERLSQIFGEWPSRFDHQLFEAAQRLRLSTVVSALGSIRDTATRFVFQQDVVSRLSVFSRGVAALSELGQRVQDLVAGHNCLQFIDEILRTLAYPCTCDDDIEKIRWAWPDLEPSMIKLVSLGNPNWGTQFQATRNEFCEAVHSAPPDEIDQKTIKKISRSFGRFRSSVRTGFTRVDLELLGLCERLQKIRVELSETIRNLQHE